MKKKADLAGLTALIYSERQISRARLAEKTQLAPSYITLLVRRLQQKGWLFEGEHAPSKGGRRRVLLHFNPDLAHVIGIQLGRVYLRVIVTDFLGKVLSFKKLPSETREGQAHVLELLRREIEDCLARDPAIRGIGIAHSGMIDHANGSVILWPRVQGWRDVPLQETIGREFGLPTIVEDSARTLAIAEQFFGQGKGQSDFVCVHAGVGLGAAIFIDGELYHGHDGMAGELGHTSIDEDGDLCVCGNRGCLEVYASGSAIVDRVRKALEQGVASTLIATAVERVENLSLELIAAAAENHDRMCETVLEEAGTRIGMALANMVNLLNPSRIILGGALPRVAQKTLVNSLLRSLRSRAFSRAVSRLEVVISELGEEGPAVGASLITIKQILHDLCIAEEAGGLCSQAKLSNPES